MNREIFEAESLKKLSSMWEPFIISLPLKYNVVDALNKLGSHRDQNERAFNQNIASLVSKTHFHAVTEQEGGMNSPGILWDRLTILNCKIFFTAPDSPHFDARLHNKNLDVNSELISVLNVLHGAKPPRHILLAKEATKRQKIAPELGISLWQLQSSNLAMWINQDLLYTVNVDEVDEKRLRDYIKFFSQANRIRNTAIEHIELFYSQNLLTVKDY